MKSLVGAGSGLALIMVVGVWAWFGSMPLRQASLEENSYADLLLVNEKTDGPGTWPVSHHLVTGVANYLGLPLSARSNLEEGTLAYVQGLGEAAVSRRPLGVEGWVLLAEFEKSMADEEMALAYARIGGAVGEQHPKYLDRLLPLFIRLGDTESAVATGGTLLATVPSARDRVYSQLLWSGVPPEELISRYAGTHSASDDYWETMLAWAIRSVRAGLAKALWEAAPDRSHLLATTSYPEFLSRREEFGQLGTMAQEIHTPGIPGTGVTSLAFNDSATESLCWRLRAHPDAEYRTVGEPGDDPVLQVEFTASRNTAFSHVSCMLAVPSQLQGASLVLSGEWQGRNLTTREGIYVEVLDVRGGKHLSTRTERKFGDWPWQEFTLDFDVPADTNLLLVRIGRRRTNNLDNQLMGTVSFRSIDISPRERKLSESSPETSL